MPIYNIILFSIFLGGLGVNFKVSLYKAHFQQKATALLIGLHVRECL